MKLYYYLFYLPIIIAINRLRPKKEQMSYCIPTDAINDIKICGENNYIVCGDETYDIKRCLQTEEYIVCELNLY